MNGKHFLEWLENGVFKPLRTENPNRPIQLIMDNAKYHMKAVDGALLLSEIKRKEQAADLIVQLGRRNLTKVEMMRRVNKNTGTGYDLKKLKAMLKEDGYAPQRQVNVLADRYKINVLFLPPYHPQLNPIELAWAQVKRWVADHNTTLKFDDVRNLIIQGFERVTKERASDLFEHVRKVEEQYRKRHGFDDPNFRIELDDDDMEDEEEWEEREFLGATATGDARNARLDEVLADGVIQDAGGQIEPILEVDDGKDAAEDDEEVSEGMEGFAEGVDEAEEAENRVLTMDAAAFDAFQAQRTVAPGTLRV